MAEMTYLLKKRRRSFLSAVLCVGMISVAAVGTYAQQSGDQAADNSIPRVTAAAEESLPTGMAGVLAGIAETPEPGSQVERIGTSAENVLVGQRVTTVKEMPSGIDVSASMESHVSHLERQAKSQGASARMMSDTDYEVLLKIVEAEAGEDDVKARVLVANVIMNRIEREDFPNTVADVVFQYVNGVAQFSPVYLGTIYNVNVTDGTREAVRQALNGVDYSQGALFFIQKEAAEDVGISWFESDLKRLFKYGVHEFYTYPDEVDMQTGESSEEAVLAKNETEEESI